MLKQAQMFLKSYFFLKMADVDNTLPRTCLSLLSNLSPFIEGFRFAQAATERSRKDDFDDSLRDFQFEEFDPMKEFPVIDQDFSILGVRIFDKIDNKKENLPESAEPQEPAEVSPLVIRRCECN
ncbi:uncharacterized protein LOC118203167, partial [Stegodyphus dumicola]|uniref:uncharacterized protein LOC118203167 n=1 Tax=Stegodyphus dumicola TaxID=202533 RepID=UPI0015AF4FD6